MVKASDWEQSLGDLMSQVPELKDNRIAEARFKSAYEAGQQALKHAAQSAPKTEDLDEALPDSTVQQLNTDWTRRYNLQFDSVLEPSEQLRARVYREFKKGTMTVVDMKKVRSVLTMAQPKHSDSIALPGGLQLQLEKEVSVSLRSVTDYYFAMRVLAHAWGWAGNYLRPLHGSVLRLALLRQGPQGHHGIRWRQPALVATQRLPDQGKNGHLHQAWPAWAMGFGQRLA